jgi:hypothetical protein
MLDDKQIVIVTAKMRDELYKYNKYPITSLFKVDDMRFSDVFDRTTREEYHYYHMYDL